MSKQTKHRYLNSFFITSVLYLFASFFLFYVFADNLVIEEKKPQEVKISIKHMMAQQEPVPTPIDPVEPKPIEPPPTQPKPEPVVEKKMDKPKKEKKHEQKHHEHKKHHEKKHIKEPIMQKVQEVVEPKNEIVPVSVPIQKPVEAPVKQIDTAQIQNIEDAYLSKIRSLIEQNKTYPKTAKRLNQTGKVYITFVISKDGEIKNCRIHKSSDFESLDEAALEIFAKITSFDSIPKELNKNSWEITVPIIYQITKN